MVDHQSTMVKNIGGPQLMAPTVLKILPSIAVADGINDGLECPLWYNRTDTDVCVNHHLSTDSGGRRKRDHPTLLPVLNGLEAVKFCARQGARLYSFENRQVSRY